MIRVLYQKRPRDVLVAGELSHDPACSLSSAVNANHGSKPSSLAVFFDGQLLDIHVPLAQHQEKPLNGAGFVLHFYSDKWIQERHPLQNK
jgi:hypothetical protein